MLAALVLLPQPGRAQTTELWPELDLYWRPAEHQRSYLELSSSTEREGTKREASTGLYQDYLFLPLGYVRAGFRYTFSTRGASRRESRIVTELTHTYDFSPLWHLANRARFEPRWVNGVYSYRFRERLHFQREIRPPRTMTIAPYATAEAYYDSQYRSISRLGARVGGVLRLNGRRSIDVYLARQDNSRTEPRYIDAVGLTFAFTMS